MTSTVRPSTSQLRARIKAKREARLTAATHAASDKLIRRIAEAERDGELKALGLDDKSSMVMYSNDSSLEGLTAALQFAQANADIVIVDLERKRWLLTKALADKISSAAVDPAPATQHTPSLVTNPQQISALPGALRVPSRHALSLGGKVQTTKVAGQIFISFDNPDDLRVWVAKNENFAKIEPINPGRGQPPTSALMTTTEVASFHDL